jgi:CRISPR-associated endonuclease/helicase Cas3
LRFGGLKDGLLDPDASDHAETADISTKWNKVAQFRVRRVEALYEELEEEWRFEDVFVIRCNDEGEALEWLRVEHLKSAAHKEDARSIAKPQELSEHQDWTRRAALRIAKSVSLSGAAAQALAVGCGLHDEGKKVQRWQRAFNAPRDAEAFGLSSPLAKTRGPIPFAPNQQRRKNRQPGRVGLPHRRSPSAVQAPVPRCPIARSDISD